MWFYLLVIGMSSFSVVDRDVTDSFISFNLLFVCVCRVFVILLIHIVLSYGRIHCECFVF